MVSQTFSINQRDLRKKFEEAYLCEGIDDDDIDGRQTYDIFEKLDTYSDCSDFYYDFKGADVDLRHFKKNGFSRPILVREKSGLGLRMPSSNFRVSDVKKCVGSSRIVDVMDVITQKDLVMTMKQWTAYYEDISPRTRLYNVISLEFSNTKLEQYVDQPEIVRYLDWVELAWPRHFRDISGTQDIHNPHYYPKVQKYCLMSVKGCYTDFHIDMGGTSVWYHILKGQKIFWFIEPTEENLKIYEKWTLSGKQSDTFLGDLVSKCYRITLFAGYTFFIPPGWIHAVYTPMDSLVFGGNFLHSYNIPMQLKIYELESKTKVPQKFRYPYFLELHWYVLERYIFYSLGVTHLLQVDLQDNNITQLKNSKKKLSIQLLDCINGFKKKCVKELSNIDDDVIKDAELCNEVEPISRNLTTPRAKKLMMGLNPREVQGLDLIMKWMSLVPNGLKSVPKDITSAKTLLDDVAYLVEQYKYEGNNEDVIGGLPVLKWAGGSVVKMSKIEKNTNIKMGKFGVVKKERSMQGIAKWKYRRVRCRACEPCTREDCQECQFCKDMKKFGGRGVYKKPCISRQCMEPALPAHAICSICNEKQCPENIKNLYLNIEDPKEANYNFIEHSLINMPKIEDLKPIEKMKNNIQNLLDESDNKESLLTQNKIHLDRNIFSEIKEGLNHEVAIQIKDKDESYIDSKNVTSNLEVDYISSNNVVFNKSELEIENLEIICKDKLLDHSKDLEEGSEINSHFEICNSSFLEMKPTIFTASGLEKNDSIDNSKSIKYNVDLMECTICFDVVHPACLITKFRLSVEGKIDEDAPSCWECAKCISEGKEGQSQIRFRSIASIYDKTKHLKRKNCFSTNDKEVISISPTPRSMMKKFNDINHEANLSLNNEEVYKASLVNSTDELISGNNSFSSDIADRDHMEVISNIGCNISKFNNTKLNTSLDSHLLNFNIGNLKGHKQAKTIYKKRRIEVLPKCVSRDPDLHIFASNKVNSRGRTIFKPNRYLE